MLNNRGSQLVRSIWWKPSLFFALTAPLIILVIAVVLVLLSIFWSTTGPAWDIRDAAEIEAILLPFQTELLDEMKQPGRGKQKAQRWADALYDEMEDEMEDEMDELASVHLLDEQGEILAGAQDFEDEISVVETVAFRSRLEAWSGGAAFIFKEQI